ncbi:EexN family lipoprotein [Pantoea ananatis]|uniref:EexN family lipoprotein n=1 Tax=Pantoea ananas TaxID=553 RepID=UPI001B30757F|nr:EexN family lipoprotein [Pantoea ananatis]
MYKRFTIALLVLTGFISGCDDEQKTKEWYKEHPDKMNEVILKCQQTGDETLNCRNAKAAHFENQQKNAPVPQY